MQTCLIIDEAPVIRKIASRILLQFGLAVECVATPAEAQIWIGENGFPDITIVAASASEPSGVDFVREYRRRAGQSPVVILALLAEANLGLMTRLRRAGANGYVFKPFDRRSLSDQLAPYLADEAA